MLVIGQTTSVLRPINSRVISAVLDTGAPLTMFSESLWRRFPHGEIDFVQTAGRNQFSVAGVRCTFRLGWIWLGVQDEERPIGRLAAQRVLAQFAEDGGRLRAQALVGLSHSVLAGRRLVRETTLEPDEPEPADPMRRRRTFGQVWRLTTI